ncbi:MAG: translation elongation factor Ts [Planctomycetaceae bacterium]|nr:translation elongation factor Ts [Planctomycetaceae bacterium]
MPEITAALVKQLRDETQLPMMDCKKALAESDGDVEAAKEALRKAGKKLMDGRKDRTTEEGRIGVYASVDGKVGAMIELMCESAPVASNDEFVALANDLAQQLATGPGAKSADELWSQAAPSQSGKTLEAWRDEIQNKIREVFNLTRLERIDAPCGGFVHMAKIGVLVEVEGGNDELAKDVALHVAAMNPQAANKDDLDPALVEKERQLQKERALAEGKPEAIVEKMIDGRMKNFYADHVLTEQPFVRDEAQTVGKLAKGGGMAIKRFLRWTLGETAAAE